MEWSIGAVPALAVAALAPVLRPAPALSLSPLTNELKMPFNSIWLDFSGYLQDVGTSYSDGIELVLEQSLSAQWQFNANFTWNDTAQPDGSQRLRRPKQLGNLGVSYRTPAGQFQLHSFYRWSRDAVDTSAGQIVPLDEFAVLDVECQPPAKHAAGTIRSD